jgi:hypothetical protein
MTAQWSLTATTTRRVDTVIGSAQDHEVAVTAVLAAALDAIDDARTGLSAGLPRYELRVDAEVVALIQTGTDDAGHPNHGEAATLIQRIETSRCMGVAPY